MRFHLTYDGSLKAASQSDTRADEKWNIRCPLDPQLAELWTLHPALLGKQMLYSGYPPKEVALSKQNREQLRQPIVVNGHPFVPLVRGSRYLSCSLDILFLRKGAAGSVITNSGDL